MKNLLIVITGLAIIAASTPTLHADEHCGCDERGEHREREHHEEEYEADEEEFEEHEEELEVLHRNVRLEFKVLPLEEGDRGAYVVTATPWYTTHAKFIGEKIHLDFHAGGHVRIMDDNEFFVTFEVEVGYEVPGTTAEFHVDSSARLVAGQALEVASMGDKTLVISAAYAETE